MKYRLIFFSALILAAGATYPASIDPYEKGQLAGSLGFGAMTIDAYYEICYARGVRTDNNLAGINTLLKNKWGFTFSELAEEQERNSGRNYREEAHNLVRTALTRAGGCGTTGMEQWFREFQGLHENNLARFHSAQ
jgi:hypothetical protein